MDLPSVLLEIHTALDEAGIAHAVDAAVLGHRIRVVDATDRIGLEVQASSSTDPRNLEWIDPPRALSGDPPVDRTPWRGGDFRLC